MSNITPGWFDKPLQRIIEGIAKISSSMQEIALVYVEAVDRDPAFRDHLVEKLPSVPARFWRGMERVGRGQLDGRILNGSVPYGNKLRNLSVSEQRSAIDGQLSLLVRDGESLPVRIDAITPDQAEQIFARDHIRSLPEQRAWIESRAQALRLKADNTAPIIEVDKKRRRIIVGNVIITAAELADYLRKISE